jgi:hypothetical protein
MNRRGFAKRVMSPSSATSVAVATSAKPRSACSAFTTGVSDQSDSAASMWASRRSRRTVAASTAAYAIFQHGVVRCMLERQAGEPTPVHQSPGWPVVMMAMTQQEAGELLARLQSRAHCRQSHARQIADRLVGWVWNPDRRQFTSPLQFGQVNCVPPVGLDPFAGHARNQRGSDHDA